MRKSELRNKISFSYLWYFLSFPFAHFPSYFYKNDSIVIKTDLKAFRLNISHIDIAKNIYFFWFLDNFSISLSMTWSQIQHLSSFLTSHHSFQSCAASPSALVMLFFLFTGLLSDPLGADLTLAFSFFFFYNLSKIDI